MKMRDELALYKTKCAELELRLTADAADFKHVLSDNQITQEQEISALTIAHNFEVSELTEKHKKAIESKDNSLKYRTEEGNEANRQLNNLHDILDVIPNVLPRQKENEYGNKADILCHVRLASVLAQKFM